MKRRQDVICREDEGHVEPFVIWTKINDDEIEVEPFTQFSIQCLERLKVLNELVWVCAVCVRGVLSTCAL